MSASFLQPVVRGRWRACIFACVLFPVLACSSARYAGEASFAPAHAEKMSDAYEDDADLESDGAEMEALEEMQASGDEDGRSVAAVHSAANKSRQVAPNAEDQPQSHGRQLVYTVQLEVSVRDPEADVRRAEALAREVGGWVQSLDGRRIVLRVPSKRYREVARKLESWGRVLRRNYQAQDVTAEYYDLKTRIRVLRETQAQLLALLKQAEDVKSALAVRQQLDQLTMELERALGRQRQLAEMVAMARIELELQPEEGALSEVREGQPFPWIDRLGVEVTTWQ